MRLLVDGVFFQLNNTGIARVWLSILSRLVSMPDLEIFLLDRGGAPRISGIEYIPFGRYQFNDCPADSVLIGRICEHYRIDVFSSTYYTTPVSTPMVLIVYDMIPELFGFDLSQKAWMEKGAAIAYAQRYLCISHSTRDDLLTFYPEIPSGRAVVAHCGVDDSVFYPRKREDVDGFRRQFSLERPYVLFVGSRVQHTGYKNSRLFFDALTEMGDPGFDVFCVGGEKEIDAEILGRLPAGVQCRRVELTDDELSMAYGGALALVYPSLYEGFGMPVIEAMASGCPVITTHHGSLAEAAGDAACLISGTSTDEMRFALQRLHNEAFREHLHKAGLVQARKFRWEHMAFTFARECRQVVHEARAGLYDAFFREWSRLRNVQARVDFSR